MQRIILKATNVKHPGLHGADFWIDAKGNARYDEQPKGHLKPYVAVVKLTDGSEVHIMPKADELDDEGQLIGGQAAVRDIVNRELFGEHGFKNGKFWQKKGILFEYKPRVAANGKVVVDAIQLHEGIESFTFRDSSAQRAYGKGLPSKITKFFMLKTADAGTGETSSIPAKPDVDEPAFEGTSDVPVDQIGMMNPPHHLPQTQVAIGEKLQANEDPVAIATAYLATYLDSKRPSGARTPEGRAKARADRKDQFDGIVGARKIDKLPDLAVDKFDSPEELMHMLGRANDMKWTVSAKVGNRMQTETKRAEGGMPLATLITLGMWNPENKDKRMREQLVKEFAPFLRMQARRYARVYEGTDAYRGTNVDGDKQTYMRDRERDLYNQGVAVLLHTANTYLSNDETVGPKARFDKTAKNAIAEELRKISREAALDNGASAIEDMGEEDAYHAPKVISPRDHADLRHYGPMAKKILKDVLSSLPDKLKLAFESRLWMDDSDDPDVSQERRFSEARERQRMRSGNSGEWERPWTGPSSIADRLSEVMVPLRSGDRRLGDLDPGHQTYYVQKWFGEAKDHIESHLKTSSGGLTPDGYVVEKYLRLESRLAHVNIKDIEARRSLPISAVSRSPKKVNTTHVRAIEHPAVTFFKTNQELAQRLGVMNNLDMPATMRGMNPSKHHELAINNLTTMHDLHIKARQIPNIEPLLRDENDNVVRTSGHGHWGTDPNGNAQWNEDHGVVALHEAALLLHHSRGEDTTAQAAYVKAANNLNSGGTHPMVADYNSRLKTLGLDVPDNHALAKWKSHSHTQHRLAANRMAVVEHANSERTTKKTVSDLRKAFTMVENAYADLIEVML